MSETEKVLLQPRSYFRYVRLQSAAGGGIIGNLQRFLLILIIPYGPRVPPARSIEQRAFKRNRDGLNTTVNHVLIVRNIPK